jgi:hypothetical protein
MAALQTNKIALRHWDEGDLAVPPSFAGRAGALRFWLYGAYPIRSTVVASTQTDRLTPNPGSLAI